MILALWREADALGLISIASRLFRSAWARRLFNIPHDGCPRSCSDVVEAHRVGLYSFDRPMSVYSRVFEVI